MAVTRINNNQISSASAGNVYLGINAQSKIQQFTITGGLLANNLSYGSDLTVTGNLTVQGQSTTIDTTVTTIEDPTITLASTQAGSPAVDIGFIGQRGTSNNVAFVWKESDTLFETVYTSSTSANSNSTITVTGLADFKAANVTVGANLAVTGTTSLVGNIISNANVTGNILGGNVLTAGLVSATGNGTFGNISTTGSFSVTSISATGNITGGNLLTGGLISATGNITSAANIAGANIIAGNAVIGNINVSGAIVVNNLTSNTFISALGNVIGGNVTTDGLISSTGTITSATTITGGNLATGGTVSATANITGGNINTAGNVTGGNVLTGGLVSATSTITGGNLATGGTVSATSTITGGNLATGGTVSATSTITGGNVATGGTVSATSTITGGNVATGGTVSATGAITGGNINTAGNVSATANVLGGNVITDFIYSTASNTTLTINAATISLNPTGNVGMNSRYINNLADPVADQDAATKVYVDTVAQGLDPKASVVYATTANLAPYTYNNGTSGVGATLTLTATGNLTIDGNVVTANSRVLIKNEVGAFVNNTTQSAAFNGIYVVTTAGAPGVAAVLTRSTDFNQPAEIPGAFTFVEAGTVNADTGWVCTTNAPVTVGTTQIIFAQFSGAGSYTAGNALTLNGSQFNVNVDLSGANTIAINGSNELYIPAGAVLTTPNIGAATGTSLSTTGTITGGNLATGGTVSATSTITGGNLATGGTVSATANITGGNVLTGGLISATGNVTSAANIAGGNLLTGGLISATATITGGNINTAGNVSATANINGSGAVFSGNVTAANFIGNISGNIDAAGANTQVQFNDGDILGASSGFTFNKTSNTVTVGANVDAISFNGNVYSTTTSATGTITGGNIATGGTVSATSTITGGNLATGGTVSATANITGGNVLTGGLISATGNITSAANIAGGNISIVGTVQGGNIVISGDNITDTNGRVNFNTALGAVDFAVNGTTANVLYVNATTNTASFGSSTQTTNALVAFNSPTSIVVPVGNITQRPATGVTGMFRFNTTNNTLEVYDNSAWVSVGQPAFTLISDQQFTGDGATTTFTLSAAATTNSAIVSINGVQQIPVTAYAITGTTLTFTEAPAVSDAIDVRVLTTTTTVYGISNGSGNAQVSVADGSNVVTTTGTASITGDLIVNGNATITGNVATNQINNGTSAVQIPTVNGNVNIDVGATDNMAVFAPGVLLMTANITPTANAVYSLGTASAQWKDLYVSNTTIYIGGTAVATTGSQLTVGGNPVVTAGTTTTGSTSVTGTVNGGNLATGGTVSATGTVTGGNIATGGTISGTGNITGGNIVSGGLISVAGAITSATTILGGNLATGGTVSATATITGGNVATGGTVSATANVTGGNITTAGVVTNGNITITGATIISTGPTLTLDPNGTGGIDGNVVIAGNLTVQGTTTTISSNNISTNDLVINVANNASTSSQANGGGIAVGPTGAEYASLTFNNGTTSWNTSIPLSVTGTVTAGNVATGGTASATGTITGGNLATGGTVSATANITGGNITTAGILTVNSSNQATAIVNGGTNGGGNIGSSGATFNTVYAKATTAQYADLAEKYTADAEYAAGTVLVFGGTAEVTVNAIDSDRRVAGVVSTNPGFVMNEGLDSEFAVAVALTGRVPCMVIGSVRKGDLMVAAGLGRARAEADPRVGTVIGKALEDFDGAEGTIEVVVGRF